ncbi:MAG: hypothetical protein SFU99_14110 [Saprospiraceae bacterium]|nr:hypothetical protein [Saprospiraceae bacterium]
MKPFIKPGEKITPEKIQELENMSQELEKIRQSVDAKRNQLRTEFPAAAGGMTPKLQAKYQNLRAQYLKELDIYEEKLTKFQQAVEQGEEAAEAQAMRSVEVILRKMLIAAEKDPSLKEEVDEWVESYKRTFGREDIFEV